MTNRLLYVEASPRGADSISTRLASHFIDHLRSTEPELALDHLRLWEEALPELDGPLLAAKYAVLAKRDLSNEEARAWNVVAQLIERVREADSLFVSTPMWNFGIPYKLKHWIDLITQPGLSFSFDPATGYSPLLSPKPLTIILASAGDYATGPSWGRPDLASGYLREALRFIGLEAPEIILAGPTAGDSARQEEARAAARIALNARVAVHRWPT